MAVDPFESTSFEIQFVQCGNLAVEAIELADQRPHTLVLGIIHQIPVQLCRFVPFPALGKLIAHE